MSGPPHLLLCVQSLSPGDDAANRGQVFPVVLNTGCVILDKLFTLSGSHFPNSEWMCKIIGMSEKTPGLGYKGREKKEESEMQAEGTACAKVLSRAGIRKMCQDCGGPGAWCLGSSPLCLPTRD